MWAGGVGVRQLYSEGWIRERVCEGAVVRGGGVSVCEGAVVRGGGVSVRVL